MRRVARETRRHGAGTLVRAATGRLLLLHRADGEGWSHPGGAVEPAETAERAALRELREETGLSAHGAHYLVRVLSRSMVYDVFVVDVAEEFVPRLDHEHTAFTWSEPDDIGPHLHPGCALAMNRLRGFG